MKNNFMINISIRDNEFWLINLGESLSNLQSYKVFKVSQSCQSLSKFVKVCQSCQSLSKLSKLY